MTNYTKLTDAQLHKAHQRIHEIEDATQYKALLHEVEKRQKMGKQLELADENEAARDGFGNPLTFFLTFDKKGYGRWLFIAAMLITTIYLIAYILPKYYVASLDEVNKYVTKTVSADCQIERVEHPHTEALINRYHLRVQSYRDEFWAFDAGKNDCTFLPKVLEKAEVATIWHKNGLIYQLSVDGQKRLYYGTLKYRIETLQTEGLVSYWLTLIWLWGVGFLSFCNAIAPGTFTRAKPPTVDDKITLRKQNTSEKNTQ